jgi:hypothetical protein
LRRNDGPTEKEVRPAMRKLLLLLFVPILLFAALLAAPAAARGA